MIQFAILSDIHISIEEDIHQSKILEKIINHFDEMIKLGDDIDFILICGDITSRGEKAEFDKALNFFIRLEKSLKFPRNKFIFIPGNHDYNRKDTSIAFEDVFQEKTDLDKYSKITSSKIFKMHVNDAFHNYNEFLREFLGKIPPLHGFQECIETSNLKTNLSVINSCLINTIGQDKLEPFVNIDELNNFIHLEKKNGELNICVMHHPLLYLYIDNRHQIDKILRKSYDILVSGHEHRPEIYRKSIFQNDEYLNITNGCTFLKDKLNRENYLHRFIVASFDSSNGEFIVKPWYTKNDLEYYVADNTIYEQAKRDGLLKLKISRFKQEQSKKEIDDPLAHLDISDLENFYSKNINKILECKDRMCINKYRKNIKQQTRKHLNYNEFALTALLFLIKNKSIINFQDFKELVVKNLLFQEIKHLHQDILDYYDNNYFKIQNEPVEKRISRRLKGTDRNVLLREIQELENQLKNVNQSPASILDSYKGREIELFPPIILDPEEDDEKYSTLDWYKNFGLTSNPFPSKRGLNEIDENLREEIVYPTEIIREFKRIITTEDISDIKNKSIAVYGPFGSGKTTLFQYIKRLLDLYHQKTITIFVSLEARANVEEIKKDFFLNLFYKLKRIHKKELSYPIVDIPNKQEACLKIVNDLSTVYDTMLIFIEDIYKYSPTGEFINEIIDFLRSLQIYRENFSNENFSTSFFFSSLTEIIMRIRNDNSLSGSIDFMRKMSPINLNAALEMINTRLRIFAENPQDPPQISRSYLARLKTMSKQSGTPIKTFRNYIDIILERFSRGEFKEEDISIKSDEQFILTIQKDLESTYPEINKLFLELKKRAENKFQIFKKILYVLTILWKTKTIREGSIEFLKIKPIMTHLNDLELIVKDTIDGEIIWTLKQELIDYFEKTLTRYGISPYKVFPYVFFTSEDIKVPENKHLLILKNILKRSEEYGMNFLKVLESIAEDYQKLDQFANSINYYDSEVTDEYLKLIENCFYNMIILLVLLCDRDVNEFDEAIKRYERSWYEFDELTNFAKYFSESKISLEENQKSINRKRLLREFLKVIKEFSNKIEKYIQIDNIFSLRERQIWREDLKFLNSIRRNIEDNNYIIAREKVESVIINNISDVIYLYNCILFGEDKWKRGIPEEVNLELKEIKVSNPILRKLNEQNLLINLKFPSIVKIIHFMNNKTKGEVSYLVEIDEKLKLILETIYKENPWSDEILELLELSSMFLELLLNKKIITAEDSRELQKIEDILINRKVKNPLEPLGLGLPLKCNRSFDLLLYREKVDKIHLIEWIRSNYRIKAKFNYYNEEITIFRSQ